MTFTPSDQATRDRIRTVLDQNMLVEAGAGTGKTTVLVARIVQLIETGSSDIDSLVVITFTEAAAAELSARVREGLEDALPKAKGTIADRLRVALDGLYRARIETIHAFTGSLLRERPVEAVLDPQFEMLDGVSAELMFNEAFESWLDALLTGGGQPIAKALARGLGPSLLRDAAATVNASRAALPLQLAPPAQGAAASFATALKATAVRLEKLAGRCAEPDEDKGYAQILELLRLRDSLALADEAERERIILGARAIKSAGAQYNWHDAEDCRTMKAEFRELGDSLSQAQTALREQTLAELMPDLERFVMDFEAERRRLGRADFDDLLIWSRDLLRDNLEVRGYFQRRYRNLLIDEFQDTDPIQAEIALFLASDGQKTKDWRQLKPTPGKLFLVGDPKQSIYRFRNADIAIYDQVKRGAMASAQETIQQSFRSLPSLVEWVNGVFADVFAEGKPGLQAAHVALDPPPASLSTKRSSVVVIRGDGSMDYADEVRAEEARCLALAIRHAVGEHPDAKRPWRVRDAEGERNASWGDIAVLIKTRTALPAIEEGFEDAGIRYRVEGGVSFYGRNEVRELVAILEAIDDPANQLSLMGALRSRAFACSDEDVLMWVAAGGRLDFRRIDESTEGPVADAMRVLGKLHGQRRGLSVPELVRRVLEDTRIIEITLDRQHGAQGAANLLKVAEQARVFTEAGGGSLRELARWLTRQRDTEAQESEAGVADQGDDVVRVMTIHAAKGLEFPIVALPGLGTRPKSERDPVSEPHNNRVHFEVGTKYNSFSTPGYQQALDDERDRLDAEAARVLYVGLTRAKDHLIIPAIAAKPESRSLLSLIDERLDEGTWEFPRELLAMEKTPPPPRHEKVRKTDVSAAVADECSWAEAIAATSKKAAAGLRLVAASSVKEWERVRPLAAAGNAIDGTVPLEAGPPLEIGDALHRAMESVSLPDASDLQDFARAACEEFGVTDHIDDVLAMARACLASDAIGRALAAGTWKREVPFTVAANGSGYGVGGIDMLFVEGNEIVLVDYKSDRVDPSAVDAAAEQHRGQMAIYAAGAQKASGLRVREVILVFAALGIERAINVDETLIARGENLLGAV